MPAATARPSRKTRHAQRLMRTDGLAKQTKGILAGLTVFLPCFVIWLIGNTGPNARGGTIAGLVLGFVAVGLLFVLTFYSFRKHRPRWAIGTREGWMRIHAYVGIAAGLVVLLHANFRLGGVVAALAAGSYLMTVLSGIYGLVLYHTIPRMMTADTDELAPSELIEKIEDVQEEIGKLAEGRSTVFRQVAKQETRAVRRRLGLSLLFMTKKRQREHGKADAIAAKMGQVNEDEREDFRKMFALIMQKSKFEERLFPKARYLMLLHGWLKFHVPLTAVVYAATFLHVVGVIYYGIIIP